MSGMMEPLVSIVTVVYNGVHTVEQAIKSVFAQTYQNIEYIIIDGGSTDGTLGIINKYRDRLAQFVSEPDGGIYDAMNKGIKRAHGKIIGLLNADDWYEPNAIKAVVMQFKNVGADIVAGRTVIVESDGSKILRKNRNFSELWVGMPACHQAVFITKSAYEKFGLYDTCYKIVADYELLLRMYHAGAQCSMIENVLVNYGHNGISSTAFVECAQENNDVINKYISKYSDKIPDIKRLCENRLKGAKARFMIEHSSSLLCSKCYASSEHENIVIWGTGVWGKRILKLLTINRQKISFFVDSDESKWNSEIGGILIKSPENLRNWCGNIFIAVKEHDAEIAKRLAEMRNPALRWVLLESIVHDAAVLYDAIFLQPR